MPSTPRWNRRSPPQTADRAGKVAVRWEQTNVRVALMVEDNGIGLLNPSNVFVPFYTTKPGGSGIGLVLSPADRRSAWRLHRADQSR